MKDKDFLEGYYNCSGIWQRELVGRDYMRIEQYKKNQGI